MFGQDERHGGPAMDHDATPPSPAHPYGMRVRTLVHSLALEESPQVLGNWITSPSHTILTLGDVYNQWPVFTKHRYHSQNMFNIISRIHKIYLQSVARIHKTSSPQLACITNSMLSIDNPPML